MRTDPASGRDQRASPSAPAESLPLGRARLVELARALTTQPRLLFLDEPSSGLDRAETEEMAGCCSSVCDGSGTAIVLIEHDVPMVADLAESVWVLDYGQLIAHGPDPRGVRRREGAQRLPGSARMTFVHGLRLPPGSRTRRGPRDSTPSTCGLDGSLPVPVLRACSTYRSRSLPAQRLPWSAPTAPGSPPSPGWPADWSCPPPGGCWSTDETSPVPPCTTSPLPASPTPPRAGRCSPRSPWRTTCVWRSATHLRSRTP